MEEEREGFAADTPMRCVTIDAGVDKQGSGAESPLGADELPIPAFSTWESHDGWLPPGRPAFITSPKRGVSHASEPGKGREDRERLVRAVLSSESGSGSQSQKSADDELKERVQKLKKKAVVDMWVKKTEHEPLVDRYIRRFRSLVNKDHGDRKATATSWKAGLSTFRLRKHKSTSDGRQIYHVGSMVMIARPDSSLRSIEQDAATAEPRALGCFRRRLAGNAGVNCIHMSPHGDMIITAGSTRAGGQSGSVMGAQEAGWVQMWEEARDSPGWVLLGTLDAGGRRPAVAGTSQAASDSQGLHWAGNERPEEVAMGISADIKREWGELIGDRMPPVTAITSHARLMISATGHGSLTNMSMGGPCLVITWDLKHHVAKYLMTGHTGEVTAVSFHSRKPWLVSASKDSTIRLWDFNTGAGIYCIAAHPGGVTCLVTHAHMRSYSFFDDSEKNEDHDREESCGRRTQHAATHDGILENPLHHLKSPTPTQQSYSKSMQAISKSFASHRKFLLDKMTAFEKTRREKLRGIADFSRMDTELHKKYMSNYGNQPEDLVATGGDDCLVNIFDMSDGKKVLSLKGHDREVTSVSVFKDRNPEQDRLASGSNDRTIRIWHLCSGACIRVIKTDRLINCLDFNKEEGILASASTTGAVQLWDPESGTCLANYQSLESSSSTWLKEVAFMPESNWLASLDVEGTISIWEWKTNPNTILQLDAASAACVKPSRNAKSTLGPPESFSASTNVVLSPSRTYAAVSDKRFRVRIWEVASHRILAVVGEVHASRDFMLRFFTSGMSFNPVETLLAVAGADSIVRVYDIVDGSLAHSLDHHTDRVCCAEFNPKGDSLATSGFDRTVVIWDTKTWSVSRVLKDHLEWVTALAFSPDGHWLASGSWDDRLVINDLEGSSQPQCLECYSNIWSVAWQPSASGCHQSQSHSRCLAAGTGAGMIHFFSLDADNIIWKESGAVIAHEGVVSSVSWSLMGDYLMSGGLDNAVRLWGGPKETGIPVTKNATSKQKLVVPLTPYGLYAKFSCAVTSVVWAAKPDDDCNNEGTAGSMLAISTTTAGDYLLDSSDVGQIAATYARTKFVYDKGGRDALIELAQESPLSLLALGPSGCMILHDVVHDVELLERLLSIANQNGFSSAMPYGPQPLLMTAYAIPSEPAVEVLVDSMVASHCRSSSSLGSDVGTAAVFMLATGFPDQAGKLLSAAGLKPANENVYVEKWREYNPRVRMKPGSLHTYGSNTQFPPCIWGPGKVKKDVNAKEIEVIAACTSFQYAAGIPPGQIQFDKGFTRQDEDMHGNSGLERSLLHMAYNNDAMEILDTPVGRAILEYKWRTYGKKAYMKSMIWPALLIFFTTLQSIAWYMASYHWWAGGIDINTGIDIYMNQGGKNSMSEEPGIIVFWSYLAGSCSLCLILTATSMLFNETREMLKEGINLYISSGWNQLDLAVIFLSLGSGTTTFIAPRVAQPLTQFACMICWLQVFNMLRADATFGIFVRMFLNIASDIRPLTNLQLLLIVGASFSFMGVFTNHQDDDIPIEDRNHPDAIRDIWNTVLHVYAMLLGNVDLESFSGIDYGFFYQIMFVIFVYLQTILMMNLIIAMMGESFEKVLQTAQRELTMDRAETLVRVELTMGVATMRSKGYIPRYLQVLLPKEELTSEYQGSHSQSGEWEGVAGTVTAKLGKRLDERAAKTDAALMQESQKRTEHLSEQIMLTKKDLADHMNNLEQRICSMIPNASSGPESPGRDVLSAVASSSFSARAADEDLFAPGTPGEAALRRIIREEIASLRETS